MISREFVQYLCACMCVLACTLMHACIDQACTLDLHNSILYSPNIHGIVHTSLRASSLSLFLLFLTSSDRYCGACDTLVRKRCVVVLACVHVGGRGGEGKAST